jgi:hypothetical protein
LRDNSRNKFRYKKWIFQPIERKPGTYEFDCGDDNVSEFFTHEFFHYEELRLCKTYELLTDETLAEDLPPIAFISYCNDSVKIKDLVKDSVKLPEAKPLKFYPAIKICWLGVSKHFQRSTGQPGSGGIGTDLINVTKLLFSSEENRTGCRLITVDAQNTDRAIALYEKTGFVYFNKRNTPSENPGQRLYPMFFDLNGPWETPTYLLEPYKPRVT